MKKTVDVTPIGMLQNARIWRDLYYENISKETNRQIVAIYCLLISLEMFIKSYLILLDKKYGDARELQNLGHNIKKLNDVLKKIRGTSNNKYEHPGIDEISQDLENCIEDFKLDFNINILRYPKAGDRFYLHFDYLNTKNKIVLLTETIEGKINECLTKKWQQKDGFV